MKNKFLYSLILVTGLLFAGSAGYSVYGQTPQDKPSSLTDQKYTCSVHSEVSQDQPGTCSKCGRTLVMAQDKPKSTTPSTKDTSQTKKRDATYPTMRDTSSQEQKVR